MFLLLALCFIGGIPLIHGKFETVFEWNYINFTFSCHHGIEEYDYSPELYNAYAIEVYQPLRKVFLALPRYHPKARITLASVSLDANRRNPLLTPYPNWEMNSGDDCTVLQDVSNIKVDKNGVMWVLDGKRTGETHCPAKLVLIDLKNNENTVGSYNIPQDICSERNRCIVNDIVLDGDIAYLAFYTRSDLGLLVFDRTSSEFTEIKGLSHHCQGSNPIGKFEYGIWLALTSSRDTLYINAANADYIFTVSTELLQSNKNISKHTRRDVKKIAPTGSTIGDSEGTILFTQLLLSSVSERIVEDSNVVVQTFDKNIGLLKYPGILAFDNTGYLYMTSLWTLNFHHSFNKNVINFRVLKAHTGTGDYQHSGVLSSDNQHEEHHHHHHRENHPHHHQKEHGEEVKRNDKDKIRQFKEHVRQLEENNKDEIKRQKEELKKREKELRDEIKLEKERQKEIEKEEKEEQKRQQKQKKEELKREKDEQKRIEKQEKEELKREREAQKKREKEDEEALKREKIEQKRREKEEEQEIKRLKEEREREEREELLQEQKEHHHQKSIEEQLPEQHEHHHHHHHHQATSRPSYKYSETTTKRRVHTTTNKYPSTTAHYKQPPTSAKTTTPKGKPYTTPYYHKPSYSTESTTHKRQPHTTPNYLETTSWIFPTHQHKPSYSTESTTHKRQPHTTPSYLETTSWMYPTHKHKSYYSTETTTSKRQQHTTPSYKHKTRYTTETTTHKQRTHTTPIYDDTTKYRHN